MAIPIVEIKFDKAKLRKLETELRGVKNGMPKVIMRAINKTAAPAKTQISKEIRKQLNVKAGAVKKGIFLRKATYQKWSAEIDLSTKLYRLVAYSAKQNKKGVSFRVWKSSGRKTIKNSFIATMASGHTGVFRRGITKGHKEKDAKRITRRSGIKSTVNKHNVYIAEMFGPSIGGVFHNMKSKPMVNRIIATAYQRLDKNIQHELDYVLGRIKSGRKSA